MQVQGCRCRHAGVQGCRVQGYVGTTCPGVPVPVPVPVVLICVVHFWAVVGAIPGAIMGLLAG